MRWLVLAAIWGWCWGHEEKDCSRKLARAVRKKLTKDILPLVKGLKDFRWPAGCPFDPTNDKYLIFETHKIRKKSGSPSSNWECGICHKQFKTEAYLDAHFDRKHANFSGSAEVCLADYCELFDLCHEAADKPRKAKEDNAKVPCDEQSLSDARFACEDAIDKCFPLDSDARLIHVELKRDVCRKLNCEARKALRSEEQGQMMSTALLVFLLILACVLAFTFMICCVDFSDDMMQWAQDSKVVSKGAVKEAVKMRETVKAKTGNRTKMI